MARRQIDPMELFKKAILVENLSTVPTTYQSSDKLHIHFQKKSNGGGDVMEVIYPMNSDKDAAIVLFEDEEDRESAFQHTQVFYGRTLEVQRLPPVFKSIEAEINPVYITLLPDMAYNLLMKSGKISVSCLSQLKYVEEECFQNVLRLGDGASHSFLEMLEERESTATVHSESEAIHQPQRNKDGKIAISMELDSNRTEDPEIFFRSSIQGSTSARQVDTPSVPILKTHPTTFEDEHNDEQDSKNGSTTQESKSQGKTSENDDDGSPTGQDHSIILDKYTYNYLKKIKKKELEQILKKYDVKIDFKNEDTRATFVASKKTLPADVSKAIEEFTLFFQKTHSILSRKTVNCSGITPEALKKAASLTSNKFKSEAIVTKFDEVDDNHNLYLILSSGNVEEVAQYFRNTAGIKSTKKLRTPGSVPNDINTASEIDTGRPTATNYQNGNTSYRSKDTEKWSAPSTSYSGVLQAARNPKETLGLSSDANFVTDEGIGIVIRRGDITRQHVDAIVNPSDSYLTNTGGAAKAIVSAAGPQLITCIDDIKRNCVTRYLQVTECIVTPGFNLGCRKIIHAVGPMSTSVSQHQFQRELYQTFLNCLLKAEEYQMRSLAMPLIGSGTIRAAKNRCADSLIGAIFEFSRMQHMFLSEIHLVNIDSEANEALKQSFTAAFAAATSTSFAAKVSVGNNLPEVAPTAGMQYRSQSAGRNNNDRPSYKDQTRQKTERKMSDSNLSSDQGTRSVTSTDKGKSEKATGTNATLVAENTSVRPADDKCNDCPICLTDNIEDVKVLKCKHRFCKTCIEKALEKSYMCPVCKSVCGPPKGNQPKGTMRNYTDKYSHLPGYNGVGTITIWYDIEDGIQTEDHPNPRKRFTGVTRTAYLPDNQEGQDVLALLRKAFDAGLVFTIGRSVTTGQDDTVTWNDIHHKTSKHGGTDNYGYPDPDYLTRVKEDLAAKGIV